MLKNSQLYFNVFHNASDGMAIIENNIFTECNHAIVDMLNLENKNLIIGKTILEQSPKFQADGRSSEVVWTEVMSIILGKESYKFEWLYLRKNPEPLWVEIELIDISTDHQKRYLSTWREVGDYGTIFKYAKMGLAIIDEETKFLDANSTYLDMLGYTKLELFQYHGLDVSVEKDVESSRATVKRVMHNGYIENFEKSYIRKDGKVIDVEMSLALLPDEKRILISVRDITATKRIEKELKAPKEILRVQAHYDSLTGLPNRTLFQSRLSQAIEKVKTEESKFAMLFLDLDNFKTINDAFGHQIGDQFLSKVSSKISTLVKSTDTFSRIGGDEFTIILNDIKERSDVIIFLKNIFQILKTHIIIDNYQLNAYMSVGITLCPDDTICSEKIMIYSDVAMYHVKENGKNNFAFYHHDMLEESLHGIKIENELINALKMKEFVVYYQPQIDIENESIIGMEALVKWNHPDLGLVSPDSFLPIAEKTGLLYEIDQFVRVEAMRQTRLWYEKGYRPGRVSLNLPIKQIERDGCIEFIQEAMHQTKCIPQWIEFEITENDLMLNPDRALETLRNIRSLGIDLSIDDFGIGYSSLSYLKKFPITKLKIDQSFIKDLPHDDEDVAISKAIIALAKSLNITVLAEGVEREDQKRFLLEHQCRYVQGYYYSLPITAKEYEEKFLL